MNVKATLKFPTIVPIIRRHSEAAVVMLLLGVYLLSWQLWLYPNGTIAVGAGIAAVAFGLTAAAPGLGLLVLLTEVLIGSLGHALVVPLAGQELPLRILLYSAVIAGYGFWWMRTRSMPSYHTDLIQHFSWVGFWIVAAVWGVIRGLFLQNPQARLLDDANQWAFLAAIALIPMFLSAPFSSRLKRLFRASLWAVTLFTIILLYIFTHDGVFQISLAVYRWARDTRLSEVTLLSPSFARVFIQSQIFLLMGWLMLLERSMRLPHRWSQEYFLFTGMTSALLMSFSRSFWVAMIVGVAILTANAVFTTRWAGLVRVARGIIPVFVAGSVVSLLVAYFPIPQPGAFSVTDALSSRTRLDESAVGSRWNLLPPLWHAALQYPFLGSGFGATVTYTSQDPRILEVSPNGEYTTHAFEWGLLDFWYKFGAIGISLVLFLAGWMIQLWKRGWIVSSSTVAMLLAAHTFTPYLNHPLGFTALALVSIASAHGKDLGHFFFDTPEA